MNTGEIKKMVGVVVDVHFAENLPQVKQSLFATKEDDTKVYMEVAAHIGLDRVRCIAMQDTAGLKAGDKVTDTGAPISVPVGEASLGRLFNVLGDTIDGKDGVKEETPTWSIHREAPSFDEQTTEAEVFET